MRSRPKKLKDIIRDIRAQQQPIPTMQEVREALARWPARAGAGDLGQSKPNEEPDKEG